MQTDYNLLLVLASYGVAVAASYCALELGGRIAFFEGRRQGFWLLAGAAAMGTGVWSMHFIGMQALRLPIALTYDLPLTMISWASAVGVSLLALYVISRSQLTLDGMAGGSVLMGLGICAMHHSGMYAMRMTPAITYDPALFLTSTVIALAASAAALFIGFNIRQLPDGRINVTRVAAALVMGGAICGMHYTGMASAQFAAGAFCAPGNALGGDWMGWPVALIAAAILAATVTLSVIDSHAVAARNRIARERAEAERSRSQRPAPVSVLDRSHFEARLGERLTASAGSPRPLAFAVVHAELRGHAELIARLGSVRVEEILQTLAEALSRLLLPGDCLARPAASSFALLLTAHPGRSLGTVVVGIGGVLGLSVVIRSKRHRLTWALGDSRHPEQGSSAAALLAAAMRPHQIIGVPLPLTVVPARSATA